MPIEQKQDRVVLKHPNGASTEILMFGATVISWKSPPTQGSEPIERLFVSSKAILDGSKAVRGGIPVVFPCFGAPTHPQHMKLPQHGFARSEHWMFDSVVLDNDAGVSVRLTLEPTPKISSLFSPPFHLSYVITLAEHQLSTNLHVKNTSAIDTMEFQALFHNYIRVPSSSEASISGLQHLSYFDKTASSEEERSTPRVEVRPAVDVHRFTDFVYEDAPHKYEVTWPGGGIAFRATELKNVVVWNPQQEAGSKLADMEDGGWERFVCVEPGFVRGFVKLEAEGTWIGQQVLTAINGNHAQL